MAFHDGDVTRVLGGGGGPPHFIWDTSAFAVPGVYEDIISKDNTVYPKLKHWYKGEFPGKLGGIDWLIKTMDKPKIDIESVEQMRNNVLRNYPVKYGFGDLSLTFWDDIDHQTINTLNDYFQGDVWVHGGIKDGRGDFKLRDSIVIKKFKIHEYSIVGKPPIVFTYYNSVLSSLDFDAVDDEGDESVSTIQLVLKVEGYSVE